MPNTKHAEGAAKPRFISYKDLKSLYGETRSRQQLRSAIEAGRYPPPRQLSPARIGFVTDELDRHYDNCPIVAYAPTPKGRAPK